MGRPQPTLGRRYIVRGHVQGVGFRYFVEKTAAEFAVRGWVRNAADGSVEVHAEGGEDQLSAFEGRLYIGPRCAEVRSVESAEARVLQYRDFRIQR